MFTYKNFDGENFDVFEIISSDSGLGILKKSKNKNLKVTLPLCLCVGKLDGIKNYNRNELKKFINSKEIKLFENGFDFKYEIDKLLIYAKRFLKLESGLAI